MEVDERILNTASRGLLRPQPDHEQERDQLILDNLTFDFEHSALGALKQRLETKILKYEKDEQKRAGKKVKPYTILDLKNDLRGLKDIEVQYIQTQNRCKRLIAEVQALEVRLKASQQRVGHRNILAIFLTLVIIYAAIISGIHFYQKNA